MAALLTPESVFVDQSMAEIAPEMNKPSLLRESAFIKGHLERVQITLGHKEPWVRPSDMLLGTLSTHRFRVVRPIPIDLAMNDSSAVACWGEIDEFGVGDSASLACVDLGHTLAELYETLEADQSRL